MVILPSFLLKLTMANIIKDFDQLRNSAQAVPKADKTFCTVLIRLSTESYTTYGQYTTDKRNNA